MSNRLPRRLDCQPELAADWRLFDGLGKRPQLDDRLTIQRDDHVARSKSGKNGRPIWCEAGDRQARTADSGIHALDSPGLDNQPEVAAANLAEFSQVAGASPGQINRDHPH